VTILELVVAELTRPRDLGLQSCNSRTPSSSLFSNLHFHSLKVWWVSMEVLHSFLMFLPFLCTFDSTQCGIYILNVFGRLDNSFCGFYWLGTTPIDGVFGFIYHNSVFHSIEASKSLFCSWFAF